MSNFLVFGFVLVDMIMQLLLLFEFGLKSGVNFDPSWVADYYASRICIVCPVKMFGLCRIFAIFLVVMLIFQHGFV